MQGRAGGLRVESLSREAAIGTGGNEEEKPVDLALPPLLPYQAQDVDDFFAAVAAGEKRICLVRPTGMGKTRTAQEIILRYVRQQRRAAMYTNRRPLIEQTVSVMENAGFDVGVRAASYRRNDAALLQIAMIQTELSRSLNAPKAIRDLEAKYEAGTIDAGEYFLAITKLRARATEMIDAELVIIDEAHLNCGPEAARIISMHAAEEAVILLITGTPIGLFPYADVMIGNGHTSEGRACGMLVPAIHYACDEPDLDKMAVPIGEEVSEKKATDAIMRNGVVGRVLTWFGNLNPKHLPTLLFAPSIEGSIYFAEEFTKAGVRAAHIDGEDVWLDGEFHRASSDMRRRVLQGSRDGSIVVLCNRFVLREGIDMPWLRHGIFATIFGGLQSYLQSGGRLLRADRGEDTNRRYGPKLSVTIQDHGGNWWRGQRSLNADRHWDLKLTSRQMTTIYLERMRNSKEREPQRCPRCGRVWEVLRGCECGFQFTKQMKRSRPVVQHDGNLVEVEGSTLTPRKVKHTANTQKLWTSTYWAAQKGPKGMTFMQAMAWFTQQYYYWPPTNLKLMPRDESDLIRRVRDVPMERLNDVEPPIPEPVENSNG